MSNFRRSFGYFFIELIVVTLGVSLSLLMNERLEKSKSEDRQQELLAVIAQNLQLDSNRVIYHKQFLADCIRSAESLRQVEASLPLDSFNHHLDRVCSYSRFEMVSLGFDELNSSGLRLENDSLYRQLLSYYASSGSLAREWNEIDASFVVDEMIPHLNYHMPGLSVSGESAAQLGVRAIPSPETLQDPVFQNLLATNMMYKKNSLFVAGVIEQIIHRSLADLRKELKKKRDV